MKTNSITKKKESNAMWKRYESYRLKRSQKNVKITEMVAYASQLCIAFLRYKNKEIGYIHVLDMLRKGLDENRIFFTHFATHATKPLTIRRILRQEDLKKEVDDYVNGCFNAMHYTSESIEATMRQEKFISGLIDDRTSE